MKSIWARRSWEKPEKARRFTPASLNRDNSRETLSPFDPATKTITAVTQEIHYDNQ
jgi:hypothetical protein